MSSENIPAEQMPTPLAAVVGCGLKILASITGFLFLYWFGPLYWEGVKAINTNFPYFFFLPGILGFWGLCVLEELHESKEFGFLYKVWGASSIMVINTTIIFVAYLTTIKNWEGMLWGSCWVELGIAACLAGHIGLLVLEPFRIIVREENFRVDQINAAEKSAKDIEKSLPEAETKNVQ